MPIIFSYDIFQVIYMQDGVDRIYAGTSHDHGKYSTIVPWSCGRKHLTPAQYH